MSTGAFQVGELEATERRPHRALVALRGPVRDDWEETKHPRAKGGQFASTPGGGHYAAEKIKLSDLSKVGAQLGSNPGGSYVHKETGQKFYVKHSKSNEHAKNEHYASKLYEAAGVPVLEHHLVDLGEGKLGTATKWAENSKKFSPTDPAHVAEARQHFATHAWTANWDAIGMENDNQALLGDMMHTLDVGGSLNYRAQGTPKGELFGNEVNEWDTMRDPAKGKQAAAVFSGMTSGELRHSAFAVASIPDSTIQMLTAVYGPGTFEERQQLAVKMIKRKRDLIERVIKS